MSLLEHIISVLIQVDIAVTTKIIRIDFLEKSERVDNILNTLSN